MSKFKKIKTSINDLYIIEPTVFEDDRGFFMESHNQREFAQIGMDMNFVQDNHSKSTKGTLRGLHFQVKHSQGKLVRVIKGQAYDVAVDLRENSNTYGEYFGVLLSAENKKMFYIPEGFAHGFLALSEEMEFIYKTTDYYCPECEGGIIWNDNDINIDWPLEEYELTKEQLLLSDKDRKLPTLKEFNRDN
ncbi:dTDP-4-dehydrorhamnose 3,5-epimerase [Halobacteroides halobius DSM 5150]|uniref:dTDP-4-dehydrorhamnose 3,5-epimerase n=1 Tax=Halobacteroides halobius (strain ATCC 35273 / DSM 5150 / MD-1) TaxID=748449 RepID=L0KDF2_HALHC|nr:dTDP-4-dehydrorhamnose 3,5-epimerase [Halobacteroides halobius]AGB42123.1 dTDP-4-dehydrorhamnose 3,5-epimerase [Halobacteroides halobius DSM 5150]